MKRAYCFTSQQQTFFVVYRAGVMNCKREQGLRRTGGLHIVRLPSESEKRKHIQRTGRYPICNLERNTTMFWSEWPSKYSGCRWRRGCNWISNIDSISKQYSGKPEWLGRRFACSRCRATLEKDTLTVNFEESGSFFGVFTSVLEVPIEEGTFIPPGTGFRKCLDCVSGTVQYWSEKVVMNIFDMVLGEENGTNVLLRAKITWLVRRSAQKRTDHADFGTIHLWNVPSFWTQFIKR